MKRIKKSPTKDSHRNISLSDCYGGGISTTPKPEPSRKDLEKVKGGTGYGRIGAPWL